MDSKAQWITFLTVLAGFGFQLYRESRQHKWDKQERAEKAKVDATAIAKVVTQANRTSALAATDRAEIKEAIDLNTEVSTKAFEEANNVNVKLKEMGAEILRKADEK